MSNVTLNAGSGGATLGTDTVSGTPNVDYQIVKIGYSVAGSAPTQVSSTNPLPGNLAQLAGTATDTNSGVKSAGTLRVVIATDQPSLSNAIPVSQSGTWTVTASGTVTANAGSGTFTNQQSNVTTDYDTGAGTQTMTMFGLALPASGGAVAGGTASNPLQVSLANTAANATAVKVDGSAVTQPVSGTFWQATQPVSAASLPLPAGAATSAKQPALGTAGAASADVITVQGIASMTKLLVTPDSVALPAHQSVNVDQLNGTTTDTNSGNKSAGTLRVVIATDQPSLANALPVSQSGTWTIAQGTPAAAGNAWPVTLVPQTGNGWSKFSTPKNNANTPLTNTVVSVKASAAGELGGYVIYNPNSSVAYVQVFDVATAVGVTLGTTRPDMVIPIPATSGANLEFANGVNFANGIQIAATTTDSGSTAPSTGLTVTMVYK